MSEETVYDVAIIGGGASGTSLLYMLARYTNIPNIVLIEKYGKPGQVNSKASNNSQTLHVGDIETNYSLEKVRQVKPAAMMVAYYAQSLSESERSKILFPVSKMILGVGSDEVSLLEKRFESISLLFPDLQKLSREGVARVEPEVARGRASDVPLAGLYTTEGYAVDFENLSQSFVDQAQVHKPDVSVLYNTAVTTIKKEPDGGYTIETNGQTIYAKVVVVDTDSFSLYFAKQLGYGKEFSLIPIGGSFYFSKKLLNGKVYTVQEPLLPFAAVHGDPDVRVPDMTRWGPTAHMYPSLESGSLKTFGSYLSSSGLGRSRTWRSFFKILLSPTRAAFLFRNMTYELPYFGKRLFLHNVRKIVPSIRASDVTKAHGYGGMRLQRVDTTTSELQLGEGKIVGESIVFNMTPSPGASVCLYNAFRDTEQIMTFLGHTYTFNKQAMEADLLESRDPAVLDSTSLPEGYAS